MRLRRRSFSLLSLFTALPLRATAAPLVEPSVMLAAVAAAAYELFPHDEVPRSHYEALAASFVAADGDRGARFANALGGEAFSSSSQAQRRSRLSALQGGADFFALRMHVLMGLYNDLSVTQHFGYEGSSFAQGGYLERGFDDLRWLPEPDAD